MIDSDPTGFVADDRGASRQIGYILAMTITTILITGLITASGGLVTDRIDTSTKAEMRVAGDKLAAQLMTADRLADQDDQSTIRIDPEVSTRAGGSQYNVRVVVDSGAGSTPDDYLELTSSTQDVSVIVPMQVDGPPGGGDGPVQVKGHVGGSPGPYTVTSGQLEIRYSPGGKVELVRTDS